MRRLFIILILLISVSAGLFAQTVTLTFTGRGRGGIYQEEIYQQIDSLKVRNITREWEQMIYYPDTVVVMEPLAVPMFDVKRSGLEQNVPNPFDCVTEADLTLYESDMVYVSVVDANGREYVNYRGKLGRGTHRFEITLAVPQTYLLTATTSTSKHSIKMVNLGSCGTNSISLKSSSDNDLSTKDVIANEFYIGDNMEYMAYTTYRDRVYDASFLRTHQNESEDFVIRFSIPYCEYYISPRPERMYGCESLTINGQTYYETNHNAGVLRLTSAGGCDSIVLLDVIIDHPVETDDTILACRQVEWNGVTCNSTGEYVANLYTMGGCDSTVTLHFYRVNDIRSEDYAYDCERYIWREGEFELELTETGDYEHTFMSQYGCDSIVTLHFTNTTDLIYDSIIACDQFSWCGRTYEFGGNLGLTSVHFRDTARYTNQYGCDSTRILDLTLYKIRPSLLTITHCGDFVYHGETYTESGRYVQTIRNFNGTCDSIVTLELTITDFVEDDIYPVGCDSYEYNNHIYTQTGDYDEHFTTDYGCDSIVHLHLRLGRSSSSEIWQESCDSYTWFGEEYVESGDYTHTIHGNSEGCDSVITLHLVIKHSVVNPVVQEIEACNMYMLAGERITESCVRNVVYAAANGCDSTVTYNITIHHDRTYEFDQFACESFEWNGNTFTESNSYTKHLQTVAGCDSTVTMHLTIGHNTYSYFNVTACDSYTWFGREYTVSGEYYNTIDNTQGCDSILTLNLVINRSVRTERTINECNFYDLDGTLITISGDYERTYETVNGCDSVVLYHINLNYDVQNEFSQYACGSFEWNGQTYTESGNYTEHFQTVAGCDSAVTMHLFLGAPNYGIVDEQEACDSYEWEDDTYTSAGEYQKTLTNIYGCDSVVTLHLTINPIYAINVSNTACDSYEWEGITYTESGEYTKVLHSVYGCDSVVTLNLTIKRHVEHSFEATSCGPYTWDGREYAESGDHPWTYTAANGCDSIVTLHLVYHEMVVDDRDGVTNTYCTMEYGDRVWMTENMRYLPQVNNNSSSSQERYYVYGYTGGILNVARNNANYHTYGVLYNHVAAQSACPTGWRLPTQEEWNDLVDFLVAENEYSCGNVDDNIAKSLASTTNWNTSSVSCAVGNDMSQNNASNFNGLPGGCYTGTTFSDRGKEGNWWSSTSSSSLYYRYTLKYDSARLTPGTKGTSWGFSVRCVKDY